MNDEFKIKNSTVGVVGLGLMGCSILVALLLAGHKVIGITPIPNEKDAALLRIKDQLNFCEEDGLLNKPSSDYLSYFIISSDYELLHKCFLVLECVVENVEIKELIYKNITKHISEDAIIGSNTSAVPISLLQKFVWHPERFIGIHWAEPAFSTRFMEIICGDKTSAQTTDRINQLAHHWGKEPTILKKDIRGFVTNRLMYAVYREALNLVVDEKISLEDADKAFRYDVGSWVTFMGVFRRMDFLDLKDYSTIFKNIFPLLCNNPSIPPFMQDMIDSNAQGIRSGKGLFKYTEEEARNWQEAFQIFNKDIYKLAQKYPSKPINLIYKELKSTEI